MIEWKYKSKTNNSSGYEDVIDKIRSFTNIYKQTDNDVVKEEIVDAIFNIYRNKNIFPITYYNNDGIKNEIQKCIDKNVEWDGKCLNFKYLQGINLCKFLFPNLSDVEYANSNNNNSLLKKFNNNHKLRRSIKLVLDMGRDVTPTELRNKLELIGGNVATNFHPMKAQAIYEKYCPTNGVIYDFACGFGGRMLGALTSKNNYRYFGVEPCVETYTHLNELGAYIEKTTNTKNRFKVACCGSEDYCPKRDFADFAFSSPPYFNLEIYSDEDTQCYNRFCTLESWFDGYVEPTIKNIYNILKKGAYYAVNIADFNMGNKRVEYVDKWIELSIKCGFTYIEQISMKVEVRSGGGHDRSSEKKEGIFVFQK